MVTLLASKPRLLHHTLNKKHHLRTSKIKVSSLMLFPTRLSKPTILKLKTAIQAKLFSSFLDRHYVKRLKTCQRKKSPAQFFSSHTRRTRKKEEAIQCLGSYTTEDKQVNVKNKPADLIGIPHKWHSSFSQVNFSTSSSAMIATTRTHHVFQSRSQCRRVFGQR